MSVPSNNPEIIIIGAAICDLLLKPVSKDVTEYPSYPVDEMKLTLGGDALNEATIVSRLGHRAKLLSYIGADMPGEEILAHCVNEGIDVSGIFVDEDAHTSINVGLVSEDGSRTFITDRSASLWRFSPEHLDEQAIISGQILSFASFFNSPLLSPVFAERIFKLAKENGIFICADMVHPRCGEGFDALKPALSYVDYFFPNLEEASYMTGKKDYTEIADLFLDCGVKHVLLKIGKDGVYAADPYGSCIIPAYPEANVVDTTGAGDNFAAGFMCALLEGLSFIECAEFANAVASVSIEHLGATSGVLNRLEAERRFHEYDHNRNN